MLGLFEGLRAGKEKNKIDMRITRVISTKQ